MSTIDGRYLSHRQAFSGAEDRRHSDLSNEDRAFEEKLAQLQQQDTGQQQVRDKRQLGALFEGIGELIEAGTETGAAVTEAAEAGAVAEGAVEAGAEGAAEAGAVAEEAGEAGAIGGGGTTSASPTPISQRPEIITLDGRVIPPNVGDQLRYSTSSAEDVTESASTAGAGAAAADADVATAGVDAAPQTTVSGRLKLGEGVTAERLSAPVLEKGPAGSLVSQSKPVPLVLSSSRRTILLSDKGAGAKPIVFRGTESKIYDTLEENAGRVIEHEPRKPGEELAEASEGSRSIYAGFVPDSGAAGTLTTPVQDAAVKVFRNAAGLSVRTGGIPSAEITAESLDTSGHVSQLLSNLFGKAGKGGASLVSKLKRMGALAQAAKGLADASQKTMLKISQYPEDGLTLVGTDSTTFGDIAETLRALPNRG
ncbi:hypothetical protein HW532_10120 [Kaustia mangrovi]|uniref:Uncharacterized protein n=1 Tax=Kaustia mangrovi TaxID=2593653 RepID=A0A7S8C435_9HYPH|nr:hypothetical protein [Kaustia mangrovi]QPC43014.1 hypothetical protein HW532_10120 [Kaustia mangrovi]